MQQSKSEPRDSEPQVVGRNSYLDGQRLYESPSAPNLSAGLNTEESQEVREIVRENARSRANTSEAHLLAELEAQAAELQAKYAHAQQVHFTQ